MLKSKSGTNEHPIKPFELRICGIFSWQLPRGSFAFKPTNYGLQERLMKEKTPPKKTIDQTTFVSGNRFLSSLGTPGTQFFLLIFFEF